MSEEYFLHKDNTLSIAGTKEVEDLAFYDNNTIEHAVIQEGVKRIGSWAFGYCRSLKSISIPASIDSISSNAFDGCISLQTIEVDTNNKYYSSFDGVLYSKDHTSLLLFPHGRKLLSYTIDSTVIRIEDNAFNRSFHIPELTIGESVQYIGYKSFAYCNELKKIIIPKSVFHIGYCAFADCRNLKEISVDSDNSHYRSINGCLFSKDGFVLIQYPLGCDKKDYLIGKDVARIEERAFSCSKLNFIKVSPSNDYYKDIDGVLFSKDGKHLLFYPKYKTHKKYTIPNGVEIICNSAFKENSFVEEIVFPQSIEQIDRHAFELCTNLQHLDFSNTNIRNIGWSSFSECDSLQSIVLSKRQKCIIQGHAFYGCRSLKKIEPNMGYSINGLDVFGEITPLLTKT